MNTNDLFRLDRKVALVTGGAGIYGVHISRALAEAGAHVVIASRDLEQCERVAEELGGEGLKVSAMQLDLGSGESIASLCSSIVSDFGKLDILFNNAVARSGGDPSTVTEADWVAAMQINSTGFFLSCKIFGEQMIKQRSGVIVNISSIYGVVGPNFNIYDGTTMTSPANYAFAKGGMINFTRYMASYYGQFGIRVNAISPGGFQTDQPDVFIENYSKQTPLGRMATDDDIKGAAVFLASDASGYITGQNLMVDGGWTAI
ncbi:MAG TPA: SDR family oxidoreductase [Pyrinomonadaceae bacterium]|nr:SDR family oxidoreductase [Pyrinomonadaceae bacterium]